MNWVVIIVSLFGGLALFLHGMDVMTEGLKATAGSRMKSFLQGMTRNRWTSLLAGTGITAVIQSSSVTTVLAVGFVSAGLISFQSTLGLILGANLGTTITAQIIAFKITKASWIMIAFGFLFSIVFAKKSYKSIGTIILGLGLVFLGMNVMSEATTPLKTFAPFINLMKDLDNYFLAILVGAIFTALVQSSSATTGVVIVLAMQSLLSTEAGIAIIFGANIGTCVTAVLSALGKPRAAMRVAVSHVFLNVVGVILWFAFISVLAQFVQKISEADPARQIANAHTIFNLANTFVFIWLVKPISRLVMFLVPIKKKKSELIFPELNSYYLEDTSMAIDLVNASILKLGKQTLGIVENGLTLALNGNETDLAELRKGDVIIDAGHTEILQFLQQIQSKTVSKKETKHIEKQIEAVNLLETTSDLITTNLVEAAEHRIENKFEPSELTVAKLTSLYKKAVDAFDLALKKHRGHPIKSENKLSKAEFKDELYEVRSYLIKRLVEKLDTGTAIYRFETAILEATRRLHTLARRLERKAD